MDDDDEVVILSDFRPLEPDVVDLSESSNISRGEDEAEDLLSLGPVAYAKSLCDKAGLTKEQRGPVALIALGRLVRILIFGGGG